jgi:hypothetical protein
MTRAQLAVLWGLAVGIVLVFAVLTYVLSRPYLPARLSAEPATGVPVGALEQGAIYRLPETPYSARALYDRAAGAATAWQPDASLVSAAASWPFADLDGLSGPVDWTFSFFSPGTQRIYVLNVDPDRVTPIRETLSPYPLPAIASTGWQWDSSQALNAWLNGGGGDFIRAHPIVDISAHLGSQDGQVVWAVVGTARESGSTFAVKLDAAGGDRIQ